MYSLSLGYRQISEQISLVQSSLYYVTYVNVISFGIINKGLTMLNNFQSQINYYIQWRPNFLLTEFRLNTVKCHVSPTFQNCSVSTTNTKSSTRISRHSNGKQRHNQATSESGAAACFNCVAEAKCELTESEAYSAYSISK